MWNGIRKHFTLWCFAHIGCPLLQAQSWKFPLIKVTSPKNYPKRWRLRVRLEELLKGTRSSPQDLFFQCLWLACLDKENYAEIVQTCRGCWPHPSALPEFLCKRRNRLRTRAVLWWERTFLIPAFYSFPSLNSRYLEELIKKIPGELFRYELWESLCRYRWWRKKRRSSTECKNFHPTTHRMLHKPSKKRAWTAPISIISWSL